jgi:hypothetical protein
MIALEELSSQLRGDLITPESAKDDSVRRVWNGMIDRRPAAIVCCAGVADVVTNAGDVLGTVISLAKKGDMAAAGIATRTAPPRGGTGGNRSRPNAQLYCGQIRQITPVPGICTSGPLLAPTNLLSGEDWPKSRTAP